MSMPRAACCLLLLCCLPAAAQDGKAFEKALRGHGKTAVKAHKARLVESLSTLDATLLQVDERVLAGTFDESQVNKLFASMQAYQANVLDSLYDAFLLLQTEAGPVVDAFAQADGFAEGLPRALLPGTKGQLDALREALARNVEQGSRKAIKRVEKTVKKIEKATPWRVAWRLSVPAPPLEVQIDGDGILAWQQTPLTADVALGASRHDVAEDGRVYAGGTAGQYGGAAMPTLGALLPGPVVVGPPAVNTAIERWQLTQFGVPEGTYTLLVREANDITAATISIGVP